MAPYLGWSSAASTYGKQASRESESTPLITQVGHEVWARRRCGWRCRATAWASARCRASGGTRSAIPCRWRRRRRHSWILAVASCRATMHVKRKARCGPRKDILCPRGYRCLCANSDNCWRWADGLVGRHVAVASCKANTACVREEVVHQCGTVRTCSGNKACA